MFWNTIAQLDVLILQTISFMSCYTSPFQIMKLSYTKVSRGIKGATDKSSIWDRRKIITWEGSELNENFIKSHSVSQVIKNCPAWKLTASLRGKKSYYSLPPSPEILNTSYSMEFCFVRTEIHAKLVNQTYTIHYLQYIFRDTECLLLMGPGFWGKGRRNLWNFSCKSNLIPKVLWVHRFFFLSDSFSSLLIQLLLGCIQNKETCVHFVLGVFYFWCSW